MELMHTHTHRGAMAAGPGGRGGGWKGGEIGKITSSAEINIFLANCYENMMVTLIVQMGTYTCTCSYMQRHVKSCSAELET
jgi:hypothetical protein